MNPGRRKFLLTGGAAGLGLFLIGNRSLGPSLSHAASMETFAVNHSDEEWRKILSPNQYAVLRQEATERPFTSPLNKEHREGTFFCAGCAQALFSSKAKFDSGTGWPSFWTALDKAVIERNDGSAGMIRTEVRCSRCGGHLGHVFDDGPRPTGLRYCMNGVAMTFKPVAS